MKHTLKLLAISVATLAFTGCASHIVRSGTCTATQAVQHNMQAAQPVQNTNIDKTWRKSQRK